MKRLAKSVLGVTLLEIMLVLAIAAMIIVMSVRYYQSATANSQANAAVSQIQAIASAADTLAQRSGGYTATDVNTAGIQALMPNQSMNAPWGGAITITGVPSTTTYNVQIASTPAQVCPVLRAKLIVSPNYTVPANICGSTAGNFTYTYNSAP